jgi:hemerythrin superfamily protein
MPSTHAPTTFTGGLELLIQDHRKIENLFADIRTTADPEKRYRFVEDLIRLIVIHSMTEENQLYPRYEKMCANGKAERERAVSEHKMLEFKLKELEKIGINQPIFNEKLEEIFSQFRAHVMEEEGVLFPQLQSQFSAGELMEMRDKMATVRKFGPTHPHPDQSTKMRSSIVAGSLLGLVDRTRDLFSKSNQHVDV